MCKEQSAKNVDWAHACLAYGELVENQGKTDNRGNICRIGDDELNRELMC